MVEDGRRAAQRVLEESVATYRLSDLEHGSSPELIVGRKHVVRRRGGRAGRLAQRRDRRTNPTTFDRPRRLPHPAISLRLPP